MIDKVGGIILNDKKIYLFACFYINTYYIILLGNAITVEYLPSSKEGGLIL